MGHECDVSREAGDSSRVREYLNDSRKQYLITRNGTQSRIPAFFPFVARLT